MSVHKSTSLIDFYRNCSVLYRKVHVIYAYSYRAHKCTVVSITDLPFKKGVVFRMPDINYAIRESLMYNYDVDSTKGETCALSITSHRRIL